MSGVYLGVDPGAKGGLAVLTPLAAGAVGMPGTYRDVWQWFDDRRVRPIFAVLEKVGGYVGERQPGSAMFKFGASFGALEMALVAAGIPYELVTPQAWQRGLGIVGRKKGETKTAWKNRLKAKAQSLFPEVKVTLAVSDALLIAEFCRRRRTGTL